jgi:putative transposase
MLHRLKVPALLRKILTSTNPIESMFSAVRDCEGNTKRYSAAVPCPRDGMQTSSSTLRRGSGESKAMYKNIPEVMATIGQIQEEKYVLQKATQEDLKIDLLGATDNLN